MVLEKNCKQVSILSWFIKDKWDRMNIRVISKVLLFVLWLCTFAAVLVWAFVKDPPFDPEPVTVLLGLVSAAVTALLNEYSARLSKEEFSTAYALAYGYVNNFLEPVLTQLMKRSDGSRPGMVIYLPERLTELEPSSIERLMARLREKKLTSKAVNVELSGGKARDLLTIYKSDTDFIYFDFPTTLLTLNSYIDYKMESGKDSFGEEQRLKMGREYIEKFKEAMVKMMEEKQIAEYVSFTDQSLQLPQINVEPVK